jgi:hypothetical protein
MSIHTERANVFLDDFLSENPRFTEVSSTDDPVILGECSPSSSSYTPSIKFLHGVGPGGPSMYVSICTHAGSRLTSIQDRTLIYHRDIPPERTRLRPLLCS